MAQGEKHEAFFKSAKQQCSATVENLKETTKQLQIIYANVVHDEYSPHFDIKCNKTSSRKDPLFFDFKSRDSNGMRWSNEGKIYDMVFVEDPAPSDKVNYKTVVVAGVGGSGKTEAVKEICRIAYSEKQTIFPEGVYFVQLGQNAQTTDLIMRIASIVRKSGGSHRAFQIRSHLRIKDAIDIACKWFNGKNCLFIFDDLWRSEALRSAGSEPSTFALLEQIASGPKSKIVQWSK